MKHISIQTFMDLITTKLGLHVREQEKTALADTLIKRVQALKLPSLEAYYQLLVSSYSSLAENTEWRELINTLTVNESYLFRDQGQFALLKNRVLPELIQSKQHLSAQDRTIRIWSAGCSTGEEAYSLAILLKELIPAEQSWNILILGTDINESALEQARQGVYTNWSFRSANAPVDSHIQKKYFRVHRQGWEIVPEIRNMVTFRLDNLVQNCDSTVTSETHNLDLILCRNVFIYFSKEAIASVLDRFCHALTPNGYLITGHTELHGQNLEQFQVKPFPESILYQRRVPRPQPVASVQIPRVKAAPQAVSFKTVPYSNIKDLPSTRSATAVKQPQLEAIALNDITTLLRGKAYTRAIEIAKQLLIQSPRCFQAYCLMAEAQANSGDYANATQACQHALNLNSFAVDPLYLLAHISQEQGDLEGAKSFLRRVIYLAPTSVYAYFELGCLYEQQGNIAKACKNWRSAFDGLKQTAPNATVDFQNRLTAAELQSVVEQKLNLNKS